MKPIGILGGMGPEATILLMQKVLTAVPAKDDADHVPLIVHQNSQVPSRINALIDGSGESPGPTLAQMARDLEAAGATALAMPCNTAHHYAPEVRAATSLPFLDMLELTAAHLAKSGAKRVGMLASPATRLARAFDASFSSSQLTPVWTDDQDAMLSLIQEVKAGQPIETLIGGIRDLAKGLGDAGADHLLIACTELSLFPHSLADGLPISDSLDCLTNAIVTAAKG